MILLFQLLKPFRKLVCISVCNVRFVVLPQFCEEFKENNSLCVPCGLQLADKAQPAVVRHFGLQILEHVIK